MMKTIHRFSIRLAAITIMLAARLGGVAQIALPNFAIADNFEGKTVMNLNGFIPTTDDYTLEVKATAGTEVTIATAGVKYKPKSDGTVRFVQQNGKIYVFENATYVTQFTPIYTFTESGGNLVSNGSFETVSETLSNGRWKASGWLTWNGGTETWGGGTGYVNVRENSKYCSAGTKSIILHSESRWLCQQLAPGVLEPETTYRLSCDYWTSEGWNNGGAKYQLWLGASLANNDILTIDAYTTSASDNNKHTFSTIFQTPEKLPDDVFLSFYRSVAKVDWLDNVKLTKVVPSAKGITGVSSAIYNRGAYAPENMQLGDAYIDMTSSLVNPKFNEGAIGWTNTTAAQMKISMVEKKNGDITISSGQNHLQVYSGNAISGQVCQTITALPNGRYEVSADIINWGFSGTLSLFANDGKTAIESNTGKRIVVSGIVVDGKLCLGLDFATTNGATVDFDTFALHYKGVDVDSYLGVLVKRINAAKATLASISSDYDTAPLKKAIASGEAISDNATAAEIINAISAIDKAMDDYRTYVAQKEAERKNIARFTTLIASAKAEREADLYPGTGDFDKAIATAEAFLTSLTADPSQSITIQADVLNAARENYYNSQYTIKAEQQTVSEVDLSLNGSEKYVLRVNGKPFYGTEIQLRPDKLRGYWGWNEEQIEACFKRAADDGFNTLSVPVFWSEVEPEKNYFDWHILDRYLDWCKRYGVKMELLWFSWSSGGRVQWLWNGIQERWQLRTPDYVCSADGNSEYAMMRKSWEYSLDWCDPNLRSRDAYVLSRIMEHVALWDANNGNPHTVIGVQLGNEARAHGANTATAVEIIDYYHHVGAAVKQSKYITWTRLNCVSYETSGRTNANEAKRNNGGTNIDFVGIDVYGTNASSIKGNINGQLGENGKNYRMIMEIDAKDSNSPIYQMAALAGNKAFNYYNLGPVDGNGLYGNDTTALKERAHIELVRQRNKIINLANQDIAVRKQGSGLHVYNYAGNSSNNEIGYKGIAFIPDAVNTQAVAVEHSSNQIVLLSTASGTFTIPASLNVTSAEVGHFDADNLWVKESDVTVGDDKLFMSKTSCVLLCLNGDQPATGINSVRRGKRQVITCYTLDGRRAKLSDRGMLIVQYADGHYSKILK